MRRCLFALLLTLAVSAPAAAQDMPLSQILINGEGWKKAEAPSPRVVSAPVVAQSPDGGTAFRWIPASGRFIEARQTGAPESQPFIPYAPLRTRRGQKSIEVTGLATDEDGRIYAATYLGVQVFDPTGRLCGVLTPAAPGKPERIAFEGDRLTLWVGDAKYERKLSTRGAK
jgi:sugar lactone lactonase YvrE